MAHARHRHAVQVVLVPVPVRGSPQPLKWATPSKYPVQHREAWRPRTKAPSKAEALRRLLDAINRNNIRFAVIGRTDELASDVLEELAAGQPAIGVHGLVHQPAHGQRHGRLNVVPRIAVAAFEPRDLPVGTLHCRDGVTRGEHVRAREDPGHCR